MLRYLFLSVFALLLLTACGGNDLDRLIHSKLLTDTARCERCDLSETDLSMADLGGVNGADFTGALNVSAEYGNRGQTDRSCVRCPYTQYGLPHELPRSDRHTDIIANIFHSVS
jgi:hypothetical protein